MGEAAGSRGKEDEGLIAEEVFANRGGKKPVGSKR
jgi:hypothetical protein